MKLSYAFILTTVLLPAAASAAAPPPAAPATNSGATADIPSLRFDDKGIGLLDAVRLTLQNDPSIKLRGLDVEGKQGVVQELSGQFDTILNGDGQYTYHQEELRRSVKQREQDYRDKLDAAIPKVTQLRNSYGRALDILNTDLITDPNSVDFTTGIPDPDVINEMELLKSELILTNDLIARTTDPALQKDFFLLRQETIDRSKRRFQALFDAVKNQPEELRKQRDLLGTTPLEQWNDSATAHLDVEHLFRNGIFVSPYADFNYNASNYVGKNDWDPALGGSGFPPAYRGEVGFDVVLPILRGRGSAEVASNEKAATVDAEAARLLTIHQQSQSVLSTTIAYWQLRAALENVDVAKRSVDLQGDLLNYTRQLIKAKEKARADEARVLASHSDSEARLESAERQVSEARINLARVMGIALADPALAPLPSDPFPRPPDTMSKDDAAVAQLARESPGRRLDYLASKKLEEAGRILVRGAELNARRLLNVDGRVWGTSIGEENPDFGSWVFRSARGGLTLEVPFGNDERQGRVAQNRASLKQNVIQSADVERTTILNVARLAQALRLSADRLTKAERAVTQYDQTIVDERAKLRAGDSTLIDTILTEQQTTSARAARVAALEDYAETLARLRFEAGLLVRESQGAGNVASDNLLTVPAPLSGAATK